ncbi:sensor histidine kinase [Chitinophaga tropicalis]|uniref:histidine kinase n=1 Tax=Chitinophaga tropicalis TaxID=2683588 RepID=A0A7K1U4D5_9BACT|nr:sensor histidine kinase [Chitinophaga tropicalis]MVT09224.1 hypothetical protein [Chitinophaga tropicalis]
MSNNLFVQAAPLICTWCLMALIAVLFLRLNNFRKKYAALMLQLRRQQALMYSQELDIQEAERKRIAEDIHDEIGGNLAAIRVNLQHLHYSDTLYEQKTSTLLQLIDQTSQNVRRATHNLIPPLFDDTPLTDILESLFHSLDSSGVLFHFCSNTYKPYFNSRQELVLYRIIMELTNNIIRHAHASAATVQLLYYPSYLEVLVEDDGVGFPSTTLCQGIGLRNVYARTAALGGKVHIDTGKTGTTFIIQVPITPQYEYSCPDQHRSG